MRISQSEDDKKAKLFDQRIKRALKTLQYHQAKMEAKRKSFWGEAQPADPAIKSWESFVERVNVTPKRKASSTPPADNFWPKSKR